MKKIVISMLLLFLAIYVIGQDYMEINLNKEIVCNDSCIRFYNVSNFKIKDKEVWYNIAENLYNIVLSTPKTSKDVGERDDEIDDPEYYSACDNVIFYCIDGDIDSTLLTVDNLLNNETLRRKIICKFYYSIPNDLVIDPYNYGYYKVKK